MVRKILAIVVGVMVAFLIVMAFEWIGHQLWRLPTGLDWKDTSAVAKFMAQKPLAAFAWLLLGWVIALVLGVLCCTRIANNPARWPQWITAVCFALAACSNFLLLPHPTWFVVVSLCALGATVWGAVRFFSRKSE